MFTPKALARSSYMTMVPCFLDETIEKFMDYSWRSFRGHTASVYTQISAAHSNHPAC